MNHLRFASILIAIACLLSFDAIKASRLPSRLIASLDTTQLEFKDTIAEGGGLFSVIAGDTLVLAHGNELILLFDGRVQRKISCPGVIEHFDLNRNGNGVVLCNNAFYPISALTVLPDGLSARMLPLGPGDFVFRVDMIDDSTFIASFSRGDSMAVGEIDNGVAKMRTIPWYSASADYGAPDFIGKVKNQYFYLDFHGYGNSIGISILSVTDCHITSRLEENLGEIGDAANTIWHYTRFDESSNRFYTILLNEGRLEIREFELAEFLRFGR